MRDTPCPAREAERERIARARADFLRKGGKIDTRKVEMRGWQPGSWLDQARRNRQHEQMQLAPSQRAQPPAEVEQEDEIAMIFQRLREREASLARKK